MESHAQPDVRVEGDAEPPAGEHTNDAGAPALVLTTPFSFPRSASPGFQPVPLCMWQHVWKNLASALQAWTDIPAPAPQPQLATIVLRAQVRQLFVVPACVLTSPIQIPAALRPAEGPLR